MRKGNRKISWENIAITQVRNDGGLDWTGSVEVVEDRQKLDVF